MSDGKRIASLTPEMPFHDAATLVLRVRMDAVGKRASSIRGRTHDAEGVHQLRVATRRADAALRLFRDVLPGKVYREGRKRLREIRRSAGAVRDWDVFAEDVSGRFATATDAEVAGLDFLLAYAAGRRDGAEPALSATLDDAHAGFAVLATRVVEAVRHGEKKTLGDAAPEILSRMREELATAMAEDMSDYERLHRVRILGKRLRYAMEILASCEDDHERRYAAVEEMQEALGRANDSFGAVARLTAIRAAAKKRKASWARQRAGVELMLAAHRRRANAERRKFVRGRKG